MKVEEGEAPFTDNRKIELIIDGNRKLFPVQVNMEPNSRYITYVLPKDFPRCMVRIIFGVSAEVIGGSHENNRAGHKKFELAF
ncbi:hypothetical protein [Desulfurobacterium sp.]